MSEAVALLQKSNRSARLKERKKALEEIMRVGTFMSNVMFNCGQSGSRSHATLMQSELSQMYELSQQWDAARKRWREANETARDAKEQA